MSKRTLLKKQTTFYGKYIFTYELLYIREFNVGSEWKLFTGFAKIYVVILTWGNRYSSVSRSTLRVRVRILFRNIDFSRERLPDKIESSYA